MMQETTDLTTMLHPGEQLRLKRIELDLELQDVAEELYMSKTQLGYLEKGDYDNLPGLTYVVGYWKNYANLLDINLDDAIAAHRKNLNSETSGIVLAPNHQQAHGHQEKARKRSAVLFLLLSAVFLGAIWYWQNPDDNPFNQWIENIASRQPKTSPALDPSDKAQLDDQNPSDQVVKLSNKPEPESEPVPIENGTHPEPNFSEDQPPPWLAAPASLQQPYRYEKSDNLIILDLSPTGLGIGQAADSPENQVASIPQGAAIPLGQTGNPESIAGQPTISESPTVEPAETETGVPTQPSVTQVPQPESAAPVEAGQQAVAPVGQVLIQEQTAVESEPVTAQTVTQEPAVQQQPATVPATGTEVSASATAAVEPTTPTASSEQGTLPASAAPEEVVEVAPDTSSPDWIVLKVDSSAWLDVRDSSGKKLAYKTAQSGDVLNLQGSPPFSVFIGAAGGIDVEYLGSPVKYEPHQSGLFARFQVGESQ